MSLTSQTYVDWFIDSENLTESATLATDVSAAKDWARIDASIDDFIVETLIEDAQKAFQRYTRSVLYETTVTVEYSFDKAGLVELRLPYGPVDSVTHVQEDGTDIGYTQKGDWIEITGHGGDTIEIEYIAKRYDPADEVDSDIIVGIWKYVATNYDDRENTSFEQIQEVPDGSKMKWKPYRREFL